MSEWVWQLIRGNVNFPDMNCSCPMIDSSSLVTLVDVVIVVVWNVQISPRERERLCGIVFFFISGLAALFPFSASKCPNKSSCCTTSVHLPSLLWQPCAKHWSELLCTAYYDHKAPQRYRYGWRFVKSVQKSVLTLCCTHIQAVVGGFICYYPTTLLFFLLLLGQSASLVEVIQCSSASLNLWTVFFHFTIHSSYIKSW